MSTTNERRETIVGSVVLLVILGLIAWGIWSVWTMTVGTVLILLAIGVLWLPVFTDWMDG